MKCCVFIFIMVFQAMMCEKDSSKLRRKLIVPKNDDSCKKIKCPTVEDPQCVRMNRHDLSLTFHIIATNKCELDYWKCHEGVEGKIVPMKYCSNNAGSTSKKNKNKIGQKHIRAKRRVNYFDLPIMPNLRQAVKEESDERRPQLDKDSSQVSQQPRPCDNESSESRDPRPANVHLVAKPSNTATSATSTPQPMQFGRFEHPIKDPWDTSMWNKIPRDLLLYLVV